MNKSKKNLKNVKKQSSKSSSNLRTMPTCSNKDHIESNKNLKQKKKINLSSQKSKEKMLNSLHHMKHPSIRLISELYQKKFGKTTKNIIELYNFYLDSVKNDKKCGEEQ